MTDPWVLTSFILVTYDLTVLSHEAQNKNGVENGEWLILPLKFSEESTEKFRF